MRHIAVIAAAGWKGTSSMFPDLAPDIPEPLLPLGDGETILSRQVRQFRERGFEPYIGVGEPGCTFGWWIQNQAKYGAVSDELAAAEGLLSPWTEERVAYVRSLGETVLCPDPDSTSHHETYRLILEAAGYDWERAIFSHGDMLISDALLDDYLALPWPCHIVYHQHTWLVLDPPAARVYCQDITTQFDDEFEHVGGARQCRMWDALDCNWADTLHAAAPLVSGEEAFPYRSGEFMDVDHHTAYTRALEWVKQQQVTAVVLAAGQGTRMGTQTPKQYLPLRGYTVLEHTLSWLQRSPLIGQVVLVTSEDRLAYCKEVVARYTLNKVRRIVEGGETRQESALNGVSAADTEYVLIHDAVRPLLDETVVGQLLEEARTWGAAAPMIGLVDTVIRENNGLLQETLDRDSLQHIQMPQAFARSVVQMAQLAAWNDGVTNSTDEAQLVLRFGHPVKLIEGTPRLMKITYPSDLAAMEYLMGVLPKPTGETIVSVVEAIELVRAGTPLIISDSEDRENEGDLYVPADLITPEMVNFMVTNCRGLVCHTITPDVAERLELPFMAEGSPDAPAFTVSVDGAPSLGVTSGTSAADRAKTILATLDEATRPGDIKRPGHVFPIVARAGGLGERLGHTEASCYLAQLAGFRPSGVICEILAEDGSMALMPELIEFALEHGLKIVTIDALKEYYDDHATRYDT